MSGENTKSQEEIKDYLARIRKTIADSQTLVSNAELRIAETDRLLESQGLTREQVMSMRFTDAQLEAANAELKRRGMDTLEKWTSAGRGGSAGTPEADDWREPAPEPYDADEELAARRKKFGMMMKPFQI